ncbi:MAG: dihydrodipicolinate synthase family protein [Alphaproteobacteria bacterium]
MAHALKGAWVAALTPLNEDLSADLPAMIAHYRWLLGNGCDGIAVLGTTGEANSFTVAERRQVIDAVSESGLAGDAVMIGTGCCAFPDTVELTKAVLGAGYDNVLMLPPFYYKGVSADGLFASYAEVIQRVGDSRLRIYVYDFPQMTGLEIDAELLARLHEAYPDTVVGVKDSSGRVDDMLATCERIPGFGTFAGTEQYLTDVVRAGGAGCISATANATAPFCGAVWRALQADGPATDEAQARLTELRLMLQAYPAVPSLKALMADHTGRAAWNRVRPPMLPLDAERTKKLLAEATSLDLALPEAA